MFFINSKRTKVFPFIQRNNNNKSVLSLHSLLFQIVVIIVFAVKLIPAAMLTTSPPPSPPSLSLTIPRTVAAAAAAATNTTMAIQMTTKAYKHQQQLHTQQVEQQLEQEQAQAQEQRQEQQQTQSTPIQPPSALASVANEKHGQQLVNESHRESSIAYDESSMKSPNDRTPAPLQQQQQQQQANASLFLKNSSSHNINNNNTSISTTSFSSTLSTSTSPSTATNTASPTTSAAVNNLKRLKTFLRKTLANVTNANVNDSAVSQYTSSSSTQLPSSSFSSTSSTSSSSSSSSSTNMSSSSRLLTRQADMYDDIVVGAAAISEENVSENGFVGNISDGFNSYATATAAAADVVVMTLSNSTAAAHLDTTTTTTTTIAAASASAAVDAFPTATQTVATFIAGNKNRATTIIVYPTVSPESIVIPIVSCIFGFPILAFIVICCLRHRAKLARERDRRRNYDMQDHAVSLVRFSPIHRLNYRSSRAISLRPERSLSQGFTSLELDTVVEERVSDVEQTQTEIIVPESPMESSTSYKLSVSSS